MTTRTFTIIKPNAVAAGNTGKILAQILADGFRIRAMKMVFMSRNQAERFYAIHKGKPFFATLVMFMTSGPTMVAVLEKQDAVAELRRLVGATDPAKAEPGTIRNLYADSMTRNAIHASDSDENAEIEWSQFFAVDEIMEAEYFLPLPESEF